MGFQFIVASDDLAEIQDFLGPKADWFEIFPIPGIGVGVSIPGKIFDDLGEGALMPFVRSLRHFDLQEGRWVAPRRYS